ncbi:MAG: hypothetical protein KAS36_16380 [Anaerolineales bacterium]|nr:hypothetical protein [Anaerolineales bacterium]
MLNQEVVIIASERMDSNQKEGRDENQLVRIPKKTRQVMNPKDNTVELYDAKRKALTRFVNSRVLKIHQAYASDIKKANTLVKSGILKQSDKNKLCFVSTDTFKRITGKRKMVDSAKVWIADSIVDTLVGADPEFVLIDRHGYAVHARDVMGVRGTQTSPLGVDSYGLQAELRPEPEVNPEALIRRMKDILRNDRLAPSIADYTWKACSWDRFGIGGHLHFGTPKMLEQKKDAKFGFFVVATRLLDELVALPLCKIEAEGGVSRRNSSRFGRHGDFRKDTGRLEWRVPGGDWVAHPDLAEAVVGTSKAVCEEVHRLIDASGFENDFIVPKKYRAGDWAAYKGASVNQDRAGRVHFWTGDWEYRTKRQNNWAAWPICESFGVEKSSTEIANELHNSSPTIATTKHAFRVLRSMSTYRDYKKQIEKFIEVCSKQKKTLAKINRDMKATWLNSAKMFR